MTDSLNMDMGITSRTDEKAQSELHVPVKFKLLILYT
jgi:hypothetical protein